VEYSIQLHHFRRNLTESVVKWYIEFPCAYFYDFSFLAIVFLTHFQLPIHYEIIIELLMPLQKSTSKHIYDHIHEFWWRYWLI